MEGVQRERNAAERKPHARCASGVQVGSHQPRHQSIIGRGDGSQVVGWVFKGSDWRFRVYASITRSRHTRQTEVPVLVVNTLR